MNVLFVYGFCGLGGVETALLNRCAAIRARGVTASIFFRQFYGNGARAVAERPDVTVGLDNLPRLFQTAFDVICIVDYPEFVDEWRTRAPDSRLLLETHASITTRLQAFHRLSDNEAVAGVIVPSRYNRELLLKNSQGHRPVHIVPNGVDTQVFRPVDGPELNRRFCELTAGPVFVWVGRLEDEKNPGGFLEFASAMLARRPDAQFICIGDAPQDEDYPRRLAAGIDPAHRDRHTFIAAVPNIEMPQYYSLAGVTGGCLISTSRFESVPMTFIEAMACGCPVLSSDVGGVRELLSPAVTGYLFDANDTKAAVEIAWSISVRDSPGRSAVISGALERVRNRHSLDAVGKRFSEVLEMVGR